MLQAPISHSLRPPNCLPLPLPISLKERWGLLLAWSSWSRWGWPASPWAHLSPPSAGNYISTCLHTPLFLFELWGLNLDPSICKASTILPKQPLQSPFALLTYIELNVSLSQFQQSMVRGVAMPPSVFCPVGQPATWIIVTIKSFGNLAGNVCFIKMW